MGQKGRVIARNSCLNATETFAWGKECFADKKHLEMAKRRKGRGARLFHEPVIPSRSAPGVASVIAPHNPNLLTAIAKSSRMPPNFITCYRQLPFTTKTHWWTWPV
jgi:hypothetical protein